jgi:hypothetical protein
MGAVVLGLNSSNPLSDEDFAMVEQVMLDHIAIVVPELEENVPWMRFRSSPETWTRPNRALRKSQQARSGIRT